MRLRVALLFVVAAAVGSTVRATTAYVTDDLVLGVFTEQGSQGQRLSTLHSGTSVEVLSVDGDSTQVRLSDGTTGWVKSSYLRFDAPASVRIKDVEDALNRERAMPGGIAVAAERSEIERLRGELAARSSPRAISAVNLSWQWPTAIVAALCVGFWMGFFVLARRIKSKFGGIKVY